MRFQGRKSIKVKEHEIKWKPHSLADTNGKADAVMLLACQADRAGIFGVTAGTFNGIHAAISTLLTGDQ